MKDPEMHELPKLNTAEQTMVPAGADARTQKMDTLPRTALLAGQAAQTCWTDAEDRLANRL